MRGFNPGTEDPTAIYYYKLGWQQIMDYGEWTKAENSFRKASEADPNFILGHCLVGRISADISEREHLLEKIQAQGINATADQRLLIDMYESSIRLMNQREIGGKLPDSLRSLHYLLCENNMRQFVKKYPEADYVKAEYIEVLHGIYGAELALDSLYQITSNRQKTLPFFLGYSAVLEAERQQTDQAFALLKKLKNVLESSSIPIYYVSVAQVYAEMDSTQLAIKNLKKAVALDQNHLIAQSLLNKLCTNSECE